MTKTIIYVAKAFSYKKQQEICGFSLVFLYICNGL